MNGHGMGFHWPESRRKVWICAMFCGTLILYAARSAVPLCIAAMSVDMNWDKEIDGAVMSAFFWGYTPAQIIGGYLSDKYGGEVVLGSAAVMWALLTAIVPFLPTSTVAFMMLARVLTGLSQGLHYPSLTNIIAKRIPPSERAFHTSLVFAGGPVGTLFIGSFGSLLLVSAGWPTVFITVGFMGLLWAVLWQSFLVRPEILQQSQEINLGNIKMVEASRMKRTERMGVPWKIFLQHPAVWALIISHFSHGYAFGNLFSWLPSYFEELYPGHKKWVFNVVPWLMYFPVALISGRVADYMTKGGISVTFVRKFFQTISLCGTAFCLLLLDWMSTFEQAIICVMVAMGMIAMGSGGVPVTPQDMAPKFAGTLFGLMNSAAAFSGIIGILTSGYILEVNDSWPKVFHINAMVLIMGAGVFLIWGTAKKILN